MRVPHRCSRCERRYTFTRLWDSYHRRKSCSCGSTQFRVDRWMLVRGSQQRCNCSGYHFPHHTGSKYCEAHPFAPVYHASNRLKLPDDTVFEIWLDIVWALPPQYLGPTPPF